MCCNRETGHGGDEIESEEEDQGVHDLTGIIGREIADQPGARQGPQPWKYVVVDNTIVLDLPIQRCDSAELGFGASVCLSFAFSVTG